MAIYSGFTHWKWWLSIVFCMFTRGYYSDTRPFDTMMQYHLAKSSMAIGDSFHFFGAFPHEFHPPLPWYSIAMFHDIPEGSILYYIKYIWYKYGIACITIKDITIYNHTEGWYQPFQIYRYPEFIRIIPQNGWMNGGHKPPKRNSCHVKTPINHRELMWSIKNFNKPPFSYHILHWTNHFWWFNGGSPPVFPSAP